MQSLNPEKTQIYLQLENVNLKKMFHVGLHELLRA